MMDSKIPSMVEEEHGEKEEGDEDDEMSLSSASSSESSSSESTEGSADITVKDPYDDPCERYWRQASFAGLVALGAIVLFTTLVLVLEQDNDHFQATFESYVESLKEAVSVQDKSMYESMEMLSESITLQAASEGSKWPYVFLPHFGTQAEHLQAISGADSILMSPLVTGGQRTEWEEFSVFVGDQLLPASATTTTVSSTLPPDETATAANTMTATSDAITTAGVYPTLYTLEEDENGTVTQTSAYGSGPYSPVWQSYPPPTNLEAINYDMLSSFQLSRLYYAMNHSREAVVSPMMSFHPLVAENTTFHQATSMIFSPVFGDLSVTNTTPIVAELGIILAWEAYLSFVRDNHMHGADYVLHNTCGQLFTIRISDDTKDNNSNMNVDHNTTMTNNNNGELGGDFVVGDHHESAYEDMVGIVPLLNFAESHFNSTEGFQACAYDLLVYPTQTMRDDFKSGTAGATAAAILICFAAVLAIVYMLYHHMRTRNRQIVKSVEKSNAIIASLFPSNVRDRLFGENGGNDDASKCSKGSRTHRSFGFRLRNYLKDGDAGPDTGSVNSPIADLFPECTVLFADIVGFTAWSSMREPAQVFTLLETLYSAFDTLANELGVFKVETIGDCYVAVTGLPDPREDHAVVMAIFARECLKKMQVLTKDLEVKLGPDTGDLSMRCGLHSGPVTAGVLRGERSRFQLFGDTVNTAARIESTGQRGRIHLSQECAEQIMAAQKAHWVQAREEKVTAKGKGELQTFWLTGLGPSSSSSVASSHLSNIEGPLQIKDSAKQPLPKILRKTKPAKPIKSEAAAKTERLVNWNVDVLSRLLRQIEARRETMLERIQKANKAQDPAAKTIEGNRDEARRAIMDESEIIEHMNESPHSDNPDIIYTNEVKEIIAMPKFDRKAARKAEDPDDVELHPDTVKQLHDFVATIASLYRENSFHNFEHASHVTMSVVKLLSRIVAPDIDYPEESAVSSERKQRQMLAAKLHDHTYGITSDPMTQFAVVFSALIHDVDHTGVPNAQLILENPELGERFQNVSVAEQHSVAASWDLLMKPKYNRLRRAIYRTEAERDRFLQLIINCVMATDIVNPQLKELRNARWDKAFKMVESSNDDDINRKATIVIEHLIQASDVSHTMQHWHIFRKWNERLFREMYSAYKEKRAEKNPADFWYKGEIGFFDYYIIPLAKKLKDCGVFGVSSDEYLQYAVKNRNEWESKGQEVVQAMVESIELEYQ